MKNSLKSIVASVAFTLVGTPLFAAPGVSSVATVDQEMAATALSDQTAAQVSSIVVDGCTATAEISIGGVSVSISVTRATCAEAVRALLQELHTTV